MAQSTGITEQISKTQRPIEQVKKDLELEKNLRKTIKKELKIFAELNNFSKFGNFDIIVFEGRVFLIGVVPQNEISDFIYIKTWENPEVREVINELQISIDGKINSFKDFNINTALKFKLFFTSDIKTVNFETRVINSTVYIMGIARTDGELKQVAYIASTISGVDKTIVHILNKNDGRRINLN